MASQRRRKAPLVDSELAQDLRRIIEQGAQGKANAITAGQLCVMLGMAPTESGKRVIRAIVSQCPEAGFLVVGDDSGYFIPAAEHEADESTGRLSSQITVMSRRLDAVQRLLAKRFDRPMVPSWRPARRERVGDGQMPLGMC